MAQPVQLTTITIGLVWFILWTLFSFLAHYFARNTIRSPQTTDTGSSTQQWITVLLLTIVQLSVGAAILKLFLVLLNKGYLSSWTDSDDTSSRLSDLSQEERSEPSRIAMYLSHATATLATNASIAFVNTGSAFTIKAFEPITTAVLTSMLLGSKLQTHVVISLPLVVTGALGFVWQPSLQSTASFGLGMAFVSNLLFGVRNINLKLLQRETCTIKAKLELMQLASLVAAVVLLIVVSGLIAISSFQIPNLNFFDSLISGIFHVTYTIISTCIILKYTSVLGHATCNLLKRILVAATFYLIGHTLVSSSNWLLGGVMLLGLAIYVFPKLCPFNGSI